MNWDEQVTDDLVKAMNQHIERAQIKNTTFEARWEAQPRELVLIFVKLNKWGYIQRFSQASYHSQVGPCEPPEIDPVVEMFKTWGTGRDRNKEYKEYQGRLHIFAERLVRAFYHSWRKSVLEAVPMDELMKPLLKQVRASIVWRFGNINLAWQYDQGRDELVWKMDYLTSITFACSMHTYLEDTIPMPAPPTSDKYEYDEYLERVHRAGWAIGDNIVRKYMHFGEMPS